MTTVHLIYVDVKVENTCMTMVSKLTTQLSSKFFYSHVSSKGNLMNPSINLPLSAGQPMTKVLALILTILMATVSLAGCMDAGDPVGVEDKEENKEETKFYYNFSNVIMEVNHGENDYAFTIKLNHSAAPMHAESFETHVAQGNYDGSMFHRIISGFMIQGGDFESGDGTGGYAANWYGICNGVETTIGECPEQKDWNIPDEADNGLLHLPCTISMAKTMAANTGGSQFFIMPEDSETSHLNEVHTVFGEIIDGCEDVTEISKFLTQSGDYPSTDVVIQSATVSSRYQEEFWIPAPPDRCDIMSYTTESMENEGLILDGRMGEVPLDFTNCDFSNFDFSSMSFYSVNFDNSTFTNALFTDSVFMGGNFAKANLENADFTRTYITEFQFFEANLKTANFDYASISQSWFEGASFTGASFTNTSFNSVFSSSSDLTDVDLSSSMLKSVMFHDLASCPSALPAEWVCLNQTLLGPHANLRNIDLSNLNFSGVNLTGATLGGVNLSNSLMEGANLNGALGSLILSCPQSLPDDWNCINHNLVGPSVVLRYADLSNQDLSSLNLKGISIVLSNLTGTDFSNSDLSEAYFAGDLVDNSSFLNSNMNAFTSAQLFDCPLHLPADWTCHPDGNNHTVQSYGQPFNRFGDYETAATRLLGPNATISFFGYYNSPNLDFTNLNLSGATFDGNNFEGVNFNFTNLNDTVWIKTVCPNGVYSANIGDTCVNDLELKCPQVTALANVENVTSKNVCGIVFEQAHVFDGVRFIYDDGTYLSTGRDTINTSTNTVYWELPLGHAISSVNYTIHTQSLYDDYGIISSISSFTITTFEINGNGTGEFYTESGVYSQWDAYTTPHEYEGESIMSTGSFSQTSETDWLYFFKFAGSNWGDNQIVDTYHNEENV